MIDETPPPHGTPVLVGKYSWSYHKTIKIRYRQDSVPGTRKPSGFNCFRYPRTTQERSSGYIADDEDYSTLTASQIHHLTKVRDLPHAWDDLIRGDLKSKHPCWKRLRESQYKPKPIGRVSDPWSPLLV